jgi:hypothetical protein
MQSPIELDPLHEIGACKIPLPTGGHGFQVACGHRQTGIHTGQRIPACKKTLEDVIEEVCGPLSKTNRRADVLGFIKCPGEALHNHATTQRDAAIVMPPKSLPVIKCFHDSCRGKVSALSEELRMAIEDAALSGEIEFSWEEADQATLEVWGAGKNAEKGAKAKKEQVVAIPWSVEDIQKASPTPVPGTPEGQGKMLLTLFDDDDIIWMGDPWHSGKKRHMQHFQTARSYRESGQMSWKSYTTGATYMPGSYSRGNESVLRRKFLIAESDNLDRGQAGAVLRAVSSMGYKLRAVVDSGRRSLHGWFDLDGLDAECVAMLEGILRGFGMDAKTMRASQPVRMAGVPRTLEDGRVVCQSLLYADLA